MTKSCKVIFYPESDLEEEYNNLPENDPVKKGIKKAIEKIKEDCQAGENARKDSPILDFYRKKFAKENIKINNIRIYDLPLYYRLIYSLVPNEIEIISIILDWKDHKDYDKLNK